MLLASYELMFKYVTIQNKKKIQICIIFTPKKIMSKFSGCLFHAFHELMEYESGLIFNW